VPEKANQHTDNKSRITPMQIMMIKRASKNFKNIFFINFKIPIKINIPITMTTRYIQKGISGITGTPVFNSGSHYRCCR
jgi:hypothetical protein